MLEKYQMHEMFHKVPAIRPYLPSTARCTKSTLESYLQMYNTVYVKPIGGGGGKDVAKVWKENDHYFYILERGAPVYCSSIDKLYEKLQLVDKSYFMVQSGIDLATIRGRPFDIRLMMMRDRNNKWRYVGMLAKVAGKKSIITNVARSGGYVMPIDTALKQSLGLTGKKAKMKINEMIRLARHCTRAYGRVQYDWQIGYDLGIDKRKRVWLIEANPTVPAHKLFLKLKDKTIYRRIKRFAAFHRRKAK